MAFGREVSPTYFPFAEMTGTSSMLPPTSSAFEPRPHHQWLLVSAAVVRGEDGAADGGGALWSPQAVRDRVRTPVTASARIFMLRRRDPAAERLSPARSDLALLPPELPERAAEPAPARARGCA